MKKLFISLITVVALFNIEEITAQTLELNPETQRLTFEGVIYAEGLKADDLYNKVKEWAILTFKNSDEVIVGENKPSLIKFRFIQSYSNGVGRNVLPCYNAMVINIKDGAVKFVISEIEWAQGGSMEYSLYKKDGTQRDGGMYRKIYDDVEGKCRSITADLTKALTKKDDW